MLITGRWNSCTIFDTTKYCVNNILYTISCRKSQIILPISDVFACRQRISLDPSIFFFFFFLLMTMTHVILFVEVYIHHYVMISVKKSLPSLSDTDRIIYTYSNFFWLFIKAVELAASVIDIKQTILRYFIYCSKNKI